MDLREQLQIEQRPQDNWSTYMFCDCGNLSRTGTCEKCLRKQIEEEDTMSAEPIHVIVFTEESSGDEAIYVDGKLKYSDSTLYCCDIVTVAKGKPVLLSQVVIDFPEPTWPKSINELLPLITKETKVRGAPVLPRVSGK